MYIGILLGRINNNIIANVDEHNFYTNLYAMFYAYNTICTRIMGKSHENQL